MASMSMLLKLKLVILNLLLNMLFAMLVNLPWLSLVLLSMMANMLLSGTIDTKTVKDLKKLFMLKSHVAKFKKQLKNWRCRFELYFHRDPLICSCGHTFHFDYIFQKSYNTS